MKILNKLGLIGYLLLAIIVYREYTKSVKLEKQQETLEQIQGYEDFKWGMSLEEVFKIKKCSFLYLEMNINSVPKTEDLLTFHCPNSPISNKPTLGLMTFEENSLNKIEFIYFANLEAEETYKKIYALKTREIESALVKEIPQPRPEARSAFVLGETRNLDSYFAGTQLDINFLNIYEKLEQKFGPQTSDYNNSRSSLEEALAKQDQSASILWNVDKSSNSISVNLGLYPQNEKIVTLTFRTSK